MKTLGERLKLLRGKTTQAELASMLGIAQTTLSNYETGRNEPNIEMLGLFISHFKVNIRWLMFGEGPMRPDAPTETAHTTTKQDHIGQMRPGSALTASISPAAKCLEELKAPSIPEHYSIGLQILFEVDEAFEEVLQERNTTLSPTARAEVLCQLCRLVIDEGADNRRPAKIFRLIKGVLAANG